MRCQIRNKNHTTTLINATDANSWIATNIYHNDVDEKPTSCGSVCCLLRIIQIGFLLILLYAFGFLVKGLLFIPNLHHNSSISPVEESVFELPKIPLLNRHHLIDPPPTTLLDLKNFNLLQEPKRDLCRVDNLLFLLVVHSKPDHFRQRQAIRSTWGSLKTFADDDGDFWSSRIVFILGQHVDRFQPPGFKSDFRKLLDRETEQFEDIVVGSFQDRYHNLRYKNILGLRWAASQCSNSAFILKADDDAFIDLISLYQYLKRTFDSLSQRNILAGNVFPEGALTQRSGKWAVSVSEYPWQKYPSYLGGLAYLMTPDVAKDLYRAAHTDRIPQVWVDDVWVTGLLAQSLDLQPLYMNPRYSYDHQEMVRWLQRVGHEVRKPPFAFAHLDTSRSDWEDTLKQLWNHVLNFYHVTSDVNDHIFRTNLSFTEGLR